ncbi:MarR family transcriptional regulator [Bradyrhizobium sp. B117]|uniref:MarR family winged helix-turn-helix transcriptional regulator n=1 Tax=Bradyrhizobium sp. B117 TaxID=3140246 RepID=UPI0031830818
MKIETEVVELLLQTANAWLFEGQHSGLSDREWMALRFLGRANRFSRTPSALAGFLDTNRGRASQIAAVLESKGLVTREPSPEDKRSIILRVTSQGKKLLERDPVNVLRDQIAALAVDDRSRLRDTLRHVLSRHDVVRGRHHADICSACIFLSESGSASDNQFKCRFFRKSVSSKDISLLCSHFEGKAASAVVIPT